MHITSRDTPADTRAETSFDLVLPLSKVSFVVATPKLLPSWANAVCPGVRPRANAHGRPPSVRGGKMGFPTPHVHEMERPRAPNYV